MVKLCGMRIHKWSKQTKQCVVGGKVIIRKVCVYCHTPKEEGKYIDKVKEIISKARRKYNEYRGY